MTDGCLGCSDRAFVPRRIGSLSFLENGSNKSDAYARRRGNNSVKSFCPLNRRRTATYHHTIKSLSWIAALTDCNNNLYTIHRSLFKIEQYNLQMEHGMVVEVLSLYSVNSFSSSPNFIWIFLEMLMKGLSFSDGDVDFLNYFQ